MAISIESNLHSSFPSRASISEDALTFHINAIRFIDKLLGKMPTDHPNIEHWFQRKYRHEDAAGYIIRDCVKQDANKR